MLLAFTIKDVPNDPLTTYITGKYLCASLLRSLCKSMSLVRQVPDELLTAHVPDHNGQVMEFNRFYVEPNRRDRCHPFAKLHLVQDGCLAGRIQPEHAQPGLLLKVASHMSSMSNFTAAADVINPF